jgi:L-malate glycosyltransferase
MDERVNGPAGSRAEGTGTASPLHVGMLGPITVAEYRDHLYPEEWREDLPKGNGGSPVNLLCRELLARGQRVTIFTADPGAADEVVLNGPLLRICIVPLGQPAGRRPARDFFATERRHLVASIRRERPDVLHAQWTYQFALAAQASGLPHLITAHDAPLRILRHELIPYRIAHTLMAYRVLARARRVVSVSPYVATHLRRYMLYSGEAIVIPNGMPDEVFDRRPERRATGGPVTYATILSGWTKLKNGRAALEAFARVRSSRGGDRLVMIGTGYQPGGPAEEWARSKGLQRGVEFAGSLSHGDVVARLSNEVDVLVHPSMEEACSMVIVEASALGIPVVGGIRSGAVPWMLDDGRAGVLVDVASAERLAGGMLRLANDADFRWGLGENARRNALERFHIRRVADAYLSQYAQTVAFSSAKGWRSA